MLKIELKAGEYQEFGAVNKKSFFTFYEVFVGVEDDGGFEQIAWARWDTQKNKGWTKRPPAEFGTGHPKSQEGIDAWGSTSSDTPQDYDMPFTVFADGSAELKLNEDVTLHFDVGSFEYAVFNYKTST